MEHKSNKKVISRRNAGIGDNLLATAHAWYYAKKTNRALVINWAPSMYFSDKSKNAFGTFFEVPDEIDGVRIIYEENVGLLKRLLRRLPLFPFRFFLPVVFIEVVHKFLRGRTPSSMMRLREKRRAWSIDLIENGTDCGRDTVVFNTHFNFLDPQLLKPFFDGLKLKPRYQEKIDGFSEHFFKSKIVIGMHIRYYDKSLPYSNHTPYWLEPEKSFDIIRSRVRELTANHGDNGYVVYLATDSKVVYDNLKDSIPNLVTYAKDFQSVTFTLTLHHRVDENSYEDDLIEMFLLARSDILYRYPPSGSWFSYYGSLYAGEVII
ncbi:MAG: nodulation protein NodZ [Bacteroidales bacterium]